MARWVVVCVLLLGATGLAWGAGPVETQWQPSESWPGGAQYDARLDQSVQFWVTGKPALQVLASLQEQTGVSFGTFPPNSASERVCLALYLNPDQVTTLREVMAQLAWVLDASFLMEGEGEARKYTMLFPAADPGAFAAEEKRRRAGSSEEVKRRQEEDLECSRQAWERAKARLPELRRALALSREEVLKQYREDPLLLTLLSPNRRAVAQFVASLPEEEVSGLEFQAKRVKAWGELTAQQQAWVKEAMGSGMAVLARESGEEQDFPWPEFAVGARTDVEVGYRASEAGTGISLLLQPATAWKEANRQQYTSPGTQPSVLVADPRQRYGIMAHEEMERRQLLGETLTGGEMRGLFEEDRQWWMANERRRMLEADPTAARHLSAEATARLAARPLPVPLDRPYSLWQLQEAVARAGFSVISDCVWQPARELKDFLPLLFPQVSSPPEALALLTAAGAAQTKRLNGGYLATSAAWEWGDAGGLLRFRSLDRAVLREALLPPSVLQAVEGWLEPVRPDLTGKADLPPVTVSLDARRYAPLLAELTTAQYRLGGDLIYSDPTEAQAAYAQAFREQFFHVFRSRFPCRLVSSLSDPQWQQLQKKGLVWGKDLPLEFLAGDLAGHSLDEGEVVRLVEQPGEGSGAGDPSRWARVVAGREGEPEVYGQLLGGLPLQVTVQPRPALPLLVAEGSGPGG